jgi:CheY-like chemotaxis protein
VARRVRIVVGEGRTAQRGLLRFVLEGEGFDVVGEAKGTADLSAVIEAKEPDVVVLDDGIGVMAVSMVHEVAPRAKIVLVWPSAVVPIGGDARVEPAKILRDLGAAVTHVMAPVTALTETFVRPDWIDRVRKDPVALRGMLTAKAIKKRPSVTRLQRRSKRLHPTTERPRSTEKDTLEEKVPAPVVVLPVGASGDALEPVLDIGGSSAGGAVVDEAVDERSDWNRRLGTLALSGAAAVSALVLAFALGGGLVQVRVIRGSDSIGLLPIGVPGFSQGGGVGESPFGRGPGAGGLVLGAIDEPAGPDLGDGGIGVDGGIGGDLASPGGGSDEPVPGAQPGGDDGTGGDGGDDGTGGDGGNDGTGGDGGGGDGGAAPSDGLPGMSAEHNPHGGPPGHLGITPAHGPGLGTGASAEHGSYGHQHKH